MKALEEGIRKMVGEALAGRGGELAVAKQFAGIERGLDTGLAGEIASVCNDVEEILLRAKTKKNLKATGVRISTDILVQPALRGCRLWWLDGGALKGRIDIQLAA